ncbi:MAG: hypothetical protein PHU80_08460 [Kiritimatiellae bacterium]|nr:hypothetical protein [Kiritimatiellia bacterium]
MSLIYLLSSLPMLKFGTAPSVTAETFAAACREQLGNADAEAVEAVLNSETCSHPFVVAWQDRETILRNATARERARLTGTDSARWLRDAKGCDMRIEGMVDDAFQESDPLRRDEELDKIRWLIADELQGPDPLCKNAVFTYAAKLAILLRRAALDAEKGAAEFKKMTAVRLPDESAEPSQDDKL